MPEAGGRAGRMIVLGEAVARTQAILGGSGLLNINLDGVTPLVTDLLVLT